MCILQFMMTKIQVSKEVIRYQLSAIWQEQSLLSRGSQFVTKASIENEQPIERDNHYKSYWRNINNLKIKSLAFTNDKTEVSFRKCSA
jgi:hypothetical protein